MAKWGAEANFAVQLSLRRRKGNLTDIEEEVIRHVGPGKVDRKKLIR